MSNLFYRLPRLTFLAVGFILVAGISAFSNLGRQEDPTMSERYGRVETRYPGASAEKVESLVTEKVENSLREVPEIRLLSSTSRTGYSVVRVELYDKIESDQTDLVWSEVRDKLTDVAPQLPKGSTSPELEIRGPVAVTLGIAISGDDVPRSILARIAEELKSRLSNLPDTKETNLFGMPKEEVVVEINPYELARLGLSADTLAQLITNSDTRISAGTFNSQRTSIVVEVKDELDSVARLGRIPLMNTTSGQSVHLQDVASIRKILADPPSSIALASGRRAIVVTTTMETGQRVDLWAAKA